MGNSSSKSEFDSAFESQFGSGSYNYGSHGPVRLGEDPNATMDILLGRQRRRGGFPFDQGFTGENYWGPSNTPFRFGATESRDWFQDFGASGSVGERPDVFSSGGFDPFNRPRKPTFSHDFMPDPSPGSAPPTPTASDCDPPPSFPTPPVKPPSQSQSGPKSQSTDIPFSFNYGARVTEAPLSMAAFVNGSKPDASFQAEKRLFWGPDSGILPDETRLSTVLTSSWGFTRANLDLGSNQQSSCCRSWNDDLNIPILSTRNIHDMHARIVITDAALLSRAGKWMDTRMLDKLSASLGASAHYQTMKRACDGDGVLRATEFTEALDLAIIAGLTKQWSPTSTTEVGVTVGKKKASRVQTFETPRTLRRRCSIAEGMAAKFYARHEQKLELVPGAGIKIKGNLESSSEGGACKWSVAASPYI